MRCKHCKVELDRLMRLAMLQECHANKGGEHDFSDGGEHLCETCARTFPVCNAYNVTFGIDLDPSARGADADRVVECDGYIEKEGGR